MNARFMGFDYGTKRIGVAISNPLGWAQPLETVRNGPQGPDWQALDRLVQTWQPVGLVVGLPLNMDDSEGPMAQQARQFARRLDRRYRLPMHLVDERLTSIAATEQLQDAGLSTEKRAKLVDQVAAQQILERFLAKHGDTAAS